MSKLLFKNLTGLFLTLLILGCEQANLLPIHHISVRTNVDSIQPVVKNNKFKYQALEVAEISVKLPEGLQVDWLGIPPKTNNSNPLFVTVEENLNLVAQISLIPDSVLNLEPRIQLDTVAFFDTLMQLDTIKLLDTIRIVDTIHQFPTVNNNFKLHIEGNGSYYDLSASEGTYTVGDELNLVAVPDEGYYVEAWYRNGVRVSNKNTVRFIYHDRDVHRLVFRFLNRLSVVPND